ncbi:MAG TPA: TonB-dependent siderophore receptor [Burkholderiales bacterium]|nr:TonB-dependent siderophore receptor [Burkholderiales bacterium]
MARNPRFRLTPLAAAIAAAVAAPGPALAQAAAGAEATLPEVNVRGAAPSDDYAPGLSNAGAKTPTPVRDIPQSVTIINRAVMEAQGATSLADALRSVPGITIGAAEGGTIGNNFNLRGFSARTDLYLDGMRDRGQVYRDVFSLEQVEVLKGPSSMLFGRGSTGGVINQVSKLPTLAPHNEASVTVGTQPSLRATADLDTPLSPTSALRIAVMAQDVDSTRDAMQNKDYGVAPSLRFGIDSPTEVTLSALLQHNHDMPDYGLPPVNGAPANVDRHSFYGLTDDRTIQDVGEFTAKVKHRLTPDTTLQNQTRYAHYLVDARESGPNSVGTVAGGAYTAFPAANLGNATALPPSQLFVALGSHDRRILDNSFYNQTDVITRLQTGPLRHELVFGLEVGNERNTVSNSSRNVGGNAYFAVVPLIDPGDAAGAGLASTPGNVTNARATTFAPYVNDTITFSKQWKLVAGLRHDRFSASLSNSVNSPPTANQVVDFTSVRSGLLYQPTETQSYYVSYGTSFDPSLEALTVTNGTQSLDPEKNRSYEVGGKWDLLGGNLSLSSALFDVAKTNARTQIATGVYDLTGNVRVRGFEVGAAGRITKRWQILAGYTRLDAEIVKAADGTQGNTPANTPRSSASAWTTYSLTAEWEVGTGLTYMSPRYTSNNNAVQVPSYVRWDATLAYRQPKYELRLNVLNLANRLNYEQLIPSDRGRAVPSIDRTALLTYVQRF